MGYANVSLRRLVARDTFQATNDKARELGWIV